MRNRRQLAEAVDAYTALFAQDPTVWGAACWTVIQGEHSDDQLPGGLLGRLSDEYEVGPAVGLRELQELSSEPSADASRGGPDAMAWLVRSGETVGLLEVNGFAGSLPETLSALAGGSARVVSLYWNEAIARASLSYAVDGEVQSVDLVSADFSAATAPELEEALGELSGEATFEARGMAVVERLSGVRLDDELLGQRWPLVRFRMRQSPRPVLPHTALTGDPALAFALLQAPPDVRRGALAQLVAEVLTATGLADHAAAAACLEQFSAGQVPERTAELHQLLDELGDGYTIPPRGDVDLMDPGWLRLQAGNVLFELGNNRDDDHRQTRRFQSWLSASFALGDRWPSIRIRYLALLRETAP